MQRFRRGDTAYIIENNVVVTQVMVKSFRGGFYIVQPAGSRGAIRLRESRLFATSGEARDKMPERPKPFQWWPR